MSTNHPSVDVLQAFVSGTLGEPDASTVEDHIAACDTCREQLDRLPADSPLQRLLCGQRALEAESDAPIRPWIAKLKRLGQPGPSSQPIHNAPTDPQGPDLAGVDTSTQRTPDWQLSGSDSLDSALPPELLDHPRYRVVKLLGAGGMGAVFQAEHKLMKRPVALKIIGRHLTQKPGVVDRFRREFEAAARLSHPNIVTAYDAEEAGQTHFLVMEFVKGSDLAKVVSERGPFNVCDACDYIRQTALGLQHAHEHGMVHRDIKPSNLMLAARSDHIHAVEMLSASDVAPNRPHEWGDYERQVKILDFGLARFLSEIDSPAPVTEFGSAIGTPDYIAPEQARDAHSADIRADIYSLGCTLYFLLAGKPPFAGGNPLQKLMSHIEKNAQSILDLRNDVPQELASVITRMMAKNPADRFATPAAVATALSPFVSRVPGVEPRGPSGEPPAVTERAAMQPAAGGSKTRLQPPTAKRWLPLAAAAVLLVAAGVLFGPQIVRIATNQGQVVIKTDDPNMEVTVKEGGATLLDRTNGRTITVAAGEHQLEVTVKLPGEDAIKFHTDKFTLTRGGEEIVNVRLELAKLKGPTTPDPTRTATRPAPLSSLAFVSRPTLIDGVQSWTIEPRYHRARVLAVKYRPDGGLVASAGEDGTIRLWDPATGKLVRCLVQESAVTGVAWSPNGQKLASCAADGVLRLWDAESGRAERVLQDRAGGGKAVAWSPSGKIIASGGYSVKLTDAESGESIGSLDGHTAQINALAWSPDGKMLASASDDKTVRLWDAESRRLIRTLEGHTDWALSVAWSPDGRKLASSGHDSTVRLWNVDSADLVRTVDQGASVDSVVWSPDGKRVLWGCGELWSLDSESGQTLLSSGGEHGPIHSVDWSPNGKAIASAHFFGAVYIWDAESRKVLQTLGRSRANLTQMPRESFAWSPDGKTLAVGHTADAVRFWDAESVQLRRTIPVNIGWIRTLTWSPDGKTLACGGDGKSIRLLDPNQGRQVGSLDGHAGRVHSLTWSPDGKSLASYSGDDRTVRMWDADSGKLRGSFEVQQLYFFSWSADGSILATVGLTDRKTVRLWAAESAEPCGTLEVGAELQHAAWAPNGRSIAIATVDSHGKVQLWDAGAGQRLRTFPTNQDVYWLAWSPDGKSLASGGGGLAEAVQFWNVDSGRLRHSLEGIPSASGTWLRDGTIVAYSQNLSTLWQRDGDSGRPLRAWILLSDSESVAITPDGHFRGTPETERGLVYVVQTVAGQQTLTPDEFAEEYGWKNDPDRVRSAK